MMKARHFTTAILLPATLASGEKLFFPLPGSQANDADNTMDWEYWFNNLNNPDVHQLKKNSISYLYYSCNYTGQ